MKLAGFAALVQRNGRRLVDEAWRPPGGSCARLLADAEGCAIDTQSIGSTRAGGSGSLRRFVATGILVVAASAGVRFGFLEPERAPVPRQAASTPAPTSAPLSPVPTPAPAPQLAKRPEKAPAARPLSRAEDHWSRPSVEALLARGGDVNARGGADGKTPLLWAATGPQTDLVAPLLEAGADPLVRDALGRDAITREMELWRKGYLGRVERMLSRVRPPPDLSVIAMIAARDGDRFAEWVEGDPDLEVRWDLERTPLLWAVYYDAEDVALALIARGARLEVEDYRGDTPLHFAARNGNLLLARRFLADGADPDRANAYGQTPLALSLFAPNTAVLEHLLARGADPCIGPNGRSDLLDLARTTRSGNEAAAIALLEPAAAKRRCQQTPEQARRANARAFTDGLRALTPPPAWVLDESLTLGIPSRGDELVAATQHYYERWMGASSRAEVEALVRMRRATGYRAVLDHADDESFAFLGSGIWKPRLHREDAETALRIEALRFIHFPHFQTDEACLHCDPDEHVKGKRASLAALSYSSALRRQARLLEALDVLEKFTRERINETRPFFRSALDEDRVRLLWLLGRREEARALGEALVIERYGSYPREGKKSRLEYVLDHLRHEREAEAAAGSKARIAHRRTAEAPTTTPSER